ncbi:uncharacterized protein LOC114535788 [Dendronephthya gigantea]|uniref:uncharacterized protein LOC114535788 n=1 Tax=Dendronephthya gigantea TaxID=151771 RepID=UPI00106BF9F6|nr:uncharacterized protein LOC114535788 [Dendronephthya gigantea]
MDLAVVLFLHNQVPLKDFAEMMLEFVPKLQPILIPSIYRTLNAGCFEEYRNFKYKMDYLDNFVPNLYNGAECPVCPKENGVLIECVDACFGLARKKYRNQSSIAPRQGTLLFSDQDDVDNYVNNYRLKNGKASIQHCNRFHAGEVLPALRSKGKNDLFDEKGVFGRVCRHDFPKGFLNIKHGERISYSVYELESLKSQMQSSKNLKVVLMYDIACILSNHLTSSNREDLLQDVTLCIPMFHCYGHKAVCQMKYSPRRTQNVGLTDGEGVEKLWSFMRQFSKMTKEMSIDKRTDVLTDAALHYREHLFKRFGTSLKCRHGRAASLGVMVNNELEDLLSKLPNVNKESVRQWIENELTEITPGQEVVDMEWDESYVELQRERKRLRNELCYATEEEPDRVAGIEGKMNRNQKAIATLEKAYAVKETWGKTDPQYENAERRLVEKKKHRLLLSLHRMASERIFLLELKSKYAEGQAIAIKLSNQIGKVVNEMKRNLASCNDLCKNEYGFDEKKNPQSEIYTNTLQSQDSVIPTKIKHRLVELTYLQDRCEEELSMVKEEMLTLVNFVRHQIIEIDQYILANNASDGDLYQKGLKCLLFQKQTVHTKYLQSLYDNWKDLIDIPVSKTAELPFLSTNPGDFETFWMHDCDCCDDVS